MAKNGEDQDPEGRPRDLDTHIVKKSDPSERADNKDDGKFSQKDRERRRRDG